MLVCKRSLLMALAFVGFTSVAQAATDDDVVFAEPARDPAAATESTTTPAPAAPAKPVAHYPLASQVEAGLSYLQWNEFIDISRAGASSRGRANYAGPGVTLEYNRHRARWQWGGSTTIAAGKAASGGYGGGLTFSDGVDRLWYGWFLHPFFHYRINPTYMIGAGLLGRARIIDWGSDDTTLSTHPAPQVAVAPTLDMRWAIGDKFTLVQSFALLGLNSETQWTWSAQYVF